MFSDSSSAIASAEAPAPTTANKYMDVKFFAVRDALISGDLAALSYRPGKELTADGLTKNLDRLLFELFCERLGVVALEQLADGRWRPAGCGYT